MKRLLGAFVVLGLIGGAVWIGLNSSRDEVLLVDCGDGVIFGDDRPRSETYLARLCDLFPSLEMDVEDSACDEPKHDLDKEPNYSANYLYRWTDENGCDLRLDVIMTRQGEDACGGSSVADIVMADHLGEVVTPTTARIYVKDPDNVFGDLKTSEGFDPDAELPESAGETNHMQDRAELWVMGDGEAIYLHYGNHVERWPRDHSPPGCG